MVSTQTPDERHVLEELGNICGNYPVFAGDTISHATANECGARGWAKRNTAGEWVPTSEGWRVWLSKGGKG